MRLRRLAMTTGAALLLLATVACDRAEGGTSDAGDQTPTSTAGPASTSPTAGIIDCGVEEQVHGEGRDLDARRCLADAYATGSAATFTSTMSTIEGDPIVWTVSVLASGEVEATLDSTADRFSAPADRVVHTFTCDALTLSDVDLPSTLELTGCDGETGGNIAI